MRILPLFLLFVGFAGFAGAADFSVTAASIEFDYTINGTSGSPPLTLVRGLTYTFQIAACSCHPFEIVGAPVGSVLNNNISSGTITFNVPNAAGNYSYECSIHFFGGPINTIEAPSPTAIEQW